MAGQGTDLENTVVKSVMERVCEVEGCGAPVEADVVMLVSVTDSGFEVNRADPGDGFHCLSGHVQALSVELSERLGVWLDARFA